MLRNLVNYLRRLFHAKQPVVIPVTKHNILIVTAFINKGVMTVSYKGKVKKGVFDDNTLPNMVHDIHFQKNTEKFLGATAQLIKQLIQEK